MKKMTQNTMKIMGATMAVAGAAALMGSAKGSSSKQIKKTMQKTADKVVGFVDTISSMM